MAYSGGTPCRPSGVIRSAAPLCNSSTSPWCRKVARSSIAFFPGHDQRSAVLDQRAPTTCAKVACRSRQTICGHQQFTSLRGRSSTTVHRPAPVHRHRTGHHPAHRRDGPLSSSAGTRTRSTGHGATKALDTFVFCFSRTLEDPVVCYWLPATTHEVIVGCRLHENLQ